MRKTAVVLLLALATFAGSSSQAQNARVNNDDAARAAIRDMLSRQVDAWNAHNLEGFMAGYWNSPDLTFFSGGSVTKGWAPTLERYRAKYLAEGREMGKLDFFDLEVDVLAPDSAVVYGHWRLTMPKAEQNSGGLFSLVLRKFPDGWKIVHDHTS